MRRSDAGLPGTSGARGGAPAAESCLAPTVPEKNRVCIARVGAAHGTGGEVRLWPFTADQQAVLRYGALETADGAHAFEIEALRPAGDGLIARLKGVTDRSAAERLRNLDLYVPRARLPAPQPDEFYHADLIGLAVENGDGKAIGSVVAVHNFGAGDLLEIALTGRRDTVMLPFTATAVPRVEIAAGRIVLDPRGNLIARASQPRQPTRK